MPLLPGDPQSSSWEPSRFLNASATNTAPSADEYNAGRIVRNYRVAIHARNDLPFLPNYLRASANYFLVSSEIQLRLPGSSLPPVSLPSLSSFSSLPASFAD